MYAEQITSGISMLIVQWYAVKREYIDSNVHCMHDPNRHYAYGSVR